MISTKDYRSAEPLRGETQSPPPHDLAEFSGTATRVPAYIVRVSLDGVPVTMEVDSGATVSLLNEHTWARLPSRATPRPYTAELRTWNDSRLSVLGEIKVLVKYNDIECKLNAVVGKGAGPNLVGRDWFEALGISLNVNKILHIEMSAMQAVVSKYREVFKNELGTHWRDPVVIQVKPDATPIFLEARPVPCVIKNRVENEIDRLVANNVLRPVSFSEWATPVIPIVKKNGKICLFGDYRSTVNQATESDTYPTLTASDVFATISGGKYYTTLDLERVYTQVVFTDATARLLTVNTCKGLFTVHRLGIGVKACFGIIQRLMMALLASVPGVVVHIDEIIISGQTMPVMTQRLDTVLAQIEKAGLRLNKDKCKFAKEQVQFLDFIIDADGIRPAPSKVESILNTPEPKNFQQLQAFLGLYKFYESFIPYEATILKPLHYLCYTSQTWTWSDREQSSFDTARRHLSFDLTLVPYDPNRSLVLACKSSEYGAGAILSHVMDDGQERPIAMSSRTLHTYEQRYSQLEKTATAIMFGVNKFHKYLISRFFMIVIDCEPLLGILDTKIPLLNILSPRLMRMALHLTFYNYSITYKPVSQMGNVDGLSHWPQPVPEKPELQLYDIMLMTEAPKDFPIDMGQIALATMCDNVFNQVSHHILHGWPAEASAGQLRPYWLHRTELSIHKYCIILGCCVVVPPALRETILRAFHKADSCIVQTKSLVISYVWWPNLNDDIEDLVLNCKQRSETHQKPKMPYDWSTPAKPWSRLHIDYAGPFQNKVFLVLVDDYSKWPEVFKLNSITSNSVIRHLRMIFSTHGLCDTLVFDSGTSFISFEIEKFLLDNKIKHVTSDRLHSSTNGLVERMIKTVKEKLCKMNVMSWDVQIPNMLLGLRTTPCASTNKTPAELLFNRQLHTLHDTTNPHQQRKIRDVEVLEKIVMYRNLCTGPRWLPGTIVSKEGPSSYRVKTKNRKIVSRRIDQLIRIQTPNTQTRQTEQENQTQVSDVNMESDNQGVEEQEQVRKNDLTSQRSEQIIEIPSSDQWAIMLGIPFKPQPGYTGGKEKNKPANHAKPPYTRSDRDSMFLL